MIAHRAAPHCGLALVVSEIIGPHRRAELAEPAVIGYETTTVGCAYHQETKVERQLLETTARGPQAERRHQRPRSEIEAVLLALSLAIGRLSSASRARGVSQSERHAICLPE
jgi:hypothetical protein